MDPELARVLTVLVPPLLVGLAGIGGAAVGALLNQRGAQRLAKQTFEGQRQLARDAARRQWLTSAAQKLLEGFPERQIKYLAVTQAVMAGRVEQARHTMADLEATRELLAFSSLVGLDDPALGPAFQAYVATESDQLAAAWKLVHAAEGNTSHEELAAVSRLVDEPAHRAGIAISELQRVLARLMFADPS